MIDAYGVIKVLLKNKKVNTDNNVFRLHYKLTVILLLIFSVLVTSKQYFGDPIDCDTGLKQIDTFCWIYSTFTVRQYLHGEQGKTYTYPGIGPSPPFSSTSQTEEIISHKYYQWVCIVLFLQAAFFYIPRYFWKIWEDGRLKILVKDFGSPIVQSSWNENYKEYLTEYITSHSYTHNVYAIRFAFCEFLNFMNVTCQIFTMDWFLSGYFSGFGIAIAIYSLTAKSHETNPMSQIFPKLAKCSFHNFGPSGTIQNKEAVCVLPLNIINEKIYVILWIWFYFLAIVSLIALFFRLITFVSKTVRSRLLMGQVRDLNKKTAEAIVDHISYGDWFVLTQIGKNINPIIFNELVINVGHKITHKKSVNNVVSPMYV